MAKTYNTFTNVSVGSVLTASDYNDALENINNYREPPMCRLNRASAQTLTTATWAIVTSWNESIDTDGMFTVATDYIEIQTAGVYRVSFVVEIAQNSTGVRLATATVNNSSAIPGGTQRIATCHIPTNPTSTAGLSATCMRPFIAGDEIRLHVFQNSGGNLNLANVGNNNGPDPELAVEFVGLAS
jgi:hypothetical protein